jgi:hypothetical protein
VCKVGDNQCLIVASLALYPHAVSAATVGVEMGRGVDAHVHLVALVPDQPLLLGLLLVDIIDVAICTVCQRGYNICELHCIRVGSAIYAS